jgi:cephalosporin-C deacetylase-like acetyl esterase
MRRYQISYLLLVPFTVLLMSFISAIAADKLDTSRGDKMLAAYFRAETQKIADASAAKLQDWNDWTAHREEYRRQLREMLGLDPLPERTPLQPVVTGTLERDDFKVEKLYFQSRPHLYVTANLYLPKKITGRLPAILYVCGHSPAKKDGVSFGNKTKFQHHGAWFAQNGYVCLVIDSLQLGEIEGIHHGTYRENMWWWNSRGYTPAGVETWNSIRAIDYLVSRPEVDPKRIGMTGRSGGGAYTWYTTALDDRIKCAVPVAGITNLKNHVVDGCVEGHCDCMYMVNTYRWDFSQVAALAAPRPLLILNTENDSLFPLDGVTDIYQKVRHLYDLAGKGKDVLLQTAPGPHEDLPVLQRHALQWFNQHLKDENPPIETTAKDYFKPEELKVFDRLPADQINTRIHDTFVPQAKIAAPPSSSSEWNRQRSQWMAELREKCFAGWPAETEATKPPQFHQIFDAEVRDLRFFAYDFNSQPNVTLRLFLLLPKNVPAKKIVSISLLVQSTTDWQRFLSTMPLEFASLPIGEPVPEKEKRPHLSDVKNFNLGVMGTALVAPRGIGLTRWTQDAKKQTHIRRSFMLLGQTVDGMRVLDVRRAMDAIHAVDGLQEVPIAIIGEQPETAGVSLYAALFKQKVNSLTLYNPSKSHSAGPDFLNVLRVLDMPQAMAMDAESSRVIIGQKDDDGWQYPHSVVEKQGWGTDQITFERTTPASANNASPR